MNRIIAFFVDRSFVVNLVAGFTILVGLFALYNMNRDLHPPFEFQQIRIDAILPGATPEEIESYLTIPIEDAVESLPGIEKFTSTSSSGTSRVKIFFEANHQDIADSVESVRTRVNSIRSNLPTSVRYINVQQSKTNDLFLYWMGIENFDEESTQHRQHLKKFEQQLADIPGVVRVDPWLRRRDIYIELNSKKLISNDISTGTARAAVAEALRFMPIGQMRVADKTFAVEMANVSDSLGKISAIPLRSNRSGKVLTLSDVADVKYKVEKQYDLTRVNGHPGISMSLRKDLTTDSFALKGEVLKVIEGFNTKSPGGLRAVSLVDGPQFVEQQINVLRKNGLVGFLFVIILLIAFLNWRTAFMTALGLPVAYFGTIIILYSIGINIDLISIIGMILVIGILVDDAIIVSERYVENLESGLAPREAAIAAVKDLIVPVTGTMLTTLVAFSPIILIKSEIGVVLAAVPIVVMSALALSWLESFFILPNHLAHFVKKPPKGQAQNIFARLRQKYERSLNWALGYRYWLFASIMTVSVAGGAFLLSKVKQDFELRINSERITVFAILKESDTLENTLLTLKPIEEFMKNLPGNDIENISSFAGHIWMDGQSYQGARYAKVSGYLNRHTQYPQKLKKKIKPIIEKYIEQFPQEQFEKLYVDISRQDGDEDKLQMVSVRVRGNDDVNFVDIETDIVKQARTVDVIKEYVEDPERYQTAWQFKPNSEKLGLYGLSTSNIANQIRSAFLPDEVAEVRSGGETLKVFLERGSIDPIKFKDLQKLTVISNLGVQVPLQYLGEWHEKQSLKKVLRRDGRRNLVLDFKVNEGEGNTEVAKKDLAAQLESVVAKYPSYEIKVEDADEQQAKNRAWALSVAVVCILGVLFVMALVLGSITQPFIVGLPIPFGIVGIILALYIHNLPLGLMALIGLVGVVGVSVNASIVMVDRVNKLAKAQSGIVDRALLIKAASSRLRAILLTTLTTLAGVFPMAYAIGGESGFTQPLAFSLAWGLSFATLLTLYLLPALLEIREDVIDWARKKIGQRVTHIPVEAYVEPLVDEEFIEPNRPASQAPESQL